MLKNLSNTLLKNLCLGEKESVIQQKALLEPKKTLRTLKLKGSEQSIINFTSHDYLGLGREPSVIKAVQDAAGDYGTNISVSRTFISAPQYDEFESLLEEIFQHPLVITPTTTLAQLSAIPLLVNENDIVIQDKFVHSSIRMGISTLNLNNEVLTVPHNNIEMLEQLIIEANAKSTTENIWFFADGIYSMQCDALPISEIIRLLNKYENFHAYIDDAHGMSLYGERGEGFILDRIKKLHERMVLTVSFAKGFGMGCGGAIIVPSESLKKKILFCGKTLIFGGPIPIPMLAAGIASAKIHLSNKLSLLRNKLHENITYFNSNCRKFNIPIINDKETTPPISYLVISDWKKTISTSKSLLQKGIIANTVYYPVVPKSDVGLRFSITIEHTKSDLDHLINSLNKILNYQEKDHKVA
jgi:7-keto-8-aminopelargonate synthetase-like enzyme